MWWSADHGTLLAEHKQAIGITTNNVAEYRAPIAGLEEARRLGADEVAVAADSKTDHRADERALEGQAPRHGRIASSRQGALASTFDAVTYEWIPRELQRARRSAQPTRRWTPPRVGARPLPTHPAGAVAVPPATLDRQPGRADPHAAAAARADRTVPAAPLLRAGNPELTETGRARAGRRGPLPRRAWRRRGGRHLAAATLLRHRGRRSQALGLQVRVDDDLIETDFGAWGGLTFRRPPARPPICTCSGSGTPACARRAGRASTMCAAGAARPRPDHRRARRGHRAGGLARHADQDDAAAGARRRHQHPAAPAPRPGVAEHRRSSIRTATRRSAW